MIFVLDNYTYQKHTKLLRYAPKIQFVSLFVAIYRGPLDNLANGAIMDSVVHCHPCLAAPGRKSPGAASIIA